MRRSPRISLLALILVTPVACKTSNGGSSLRDDGSPDPSTDNPQSTDAGEAASAQILNCRTLSTKYKSVDMTPGQTYLKFMKATVKPMIDDVATSGYDLADGAGVGVAYNCSVDKVKGKVDQLGLDKLKHIGDAVSDRRVTMNNITQKIKTVDSTISVFDAANFLGFASGGGVAIKYNDSNYAMNVHYDVKNMQSGRSYGVGPAKGANDASDREYLDELEHYTHGSADNLPGFYRTILSSLVNCDASGYPSINPEGQGVASDFLAIYTAEEDRNLMQPGTIKPYWDAALLEVTMLASFHAGQSTFGLYYFDLHDQQTKFMTQTFKQTSCKLSTQSKPASMNDYWQFSRQWQSGSTSSCTRSGINLTKNEFRKMGTAITQWMKVNQPDAFNKLVSAMGVTAGGATFNLYFELSNKLISQKGLSNIDNAADLVNAWVDFIGLTQQNANAITASLQQDDSTPTPHDAPESGAAPESQEGQG